MGNVKKKVCVLVSPELGEHVGCGDLGACGFQFVFELFVAAVDAGKLEGALSPGQRSSL
jgi:hypothetical protein